MGTMPRLSMLPAVSQPFTSKAVTTSPATHNSSVARGVAMATGDGRVRDGWVAWTGARAELL